MNDYNASCLIINISFQFLKIFCWALWLPATVLWGGQCGTVIIVARKTKTRTTWGDMWSLTSTSNIPALIVAMSSSPDQACSHTSVGSITNVYNLIPNKPISTCHVWIEEKSSWKPLLHPSRNINFLKGTVQHKYTYKSTLFR